jgi:hypothetical protein
MHIQKALGNESLFFVNDLFTQGSAVLIADYLCFFGTFLL